MRKAVLFAAVLVSLVDGALAAWQPEKAQNVTPRWVAEQIDRRDTGRDARMEMTMRLFDRQGRVRARTLLLTALRAPAASDTGDRVLIRFLSPNDIDGTGFLVWEHPKKDDERFLFLPALGRVRRIAGQEKQQSFVGSDLSYEDIGGRKLDDYQYSFAEAETQWTGPDGKTSPAWKLEAKAVDATAAYPRTVSVVLKDSFVIVASDIYNRRNEREKRFEVRRLERITDIWTTTDVAMMNQLQHTRTELVISKVAYNTGLTENDFSRRMLEQRTP